MLYHKYRPQTLDEFMGNEETVTILRAELQKPPEERAHAFLLHGPTGCGKTTLARIIAKELGAGEFDFREIDSADFRGIDTIRDIIHQSQFKPLGRCKVWLLDEVHQLSKDGQSALLKSLEETPKHVYYILATTNPEQLLETVRARCLQLAVTPLPEKQLIRLLRRIAKFEGHKIDREILEQIAIESQGRPRDAIQLLDKALNVPPEQRLSIVQEYARRQSKVVDLCRCFFEAAPWKKVANILQSLKDAGEDPERVRRAILGYCGSVLLKQDNVNAALVIEELSEPLYSTGWPGLIAGCYRCIMGGGM